MHACIGLHLVSLSNNVHKSTSSIWAAADYNWITSQCESENISGHKLHDVRIEFENTVPTSTLNVTSQLTEN